MPIIEVCANGVESALIAQQAGADRVELCAAMAEGGCTPSYATIQLARERLTDTKLHVLVRPRGGDFLYSPLEQEIMLRDIALAKSAGADGVAVGCLTKDGDIDCRLLRRLIAEAGEMSVTFHRAFDLCRRPAEAMEAIIGEGVSRILTSGQEATAVEGIPLLRSLVRQAAGRIVIMPGCGVNAGNIAGIARQTGATEFHLSGRVRVASQMAYRNPKASMGGTVRVDDYDRDLTSGFVLRATCYASRQVNK